MEKKLTKRDLFGMLAEIIELADVATDERVMLSEFITHEVELIEKKAAKSKTYSRKKPEDTMKDAIEEVLSTDEFKLTNDILEAIKGEFPDATSSKVTARLTALVKDGFVIKEDVKIEKRTLKGYKLVS